jgi:hypothetical protein
MAGWSFSTLACGILLSEKLSWRDSAQLASKYGCNGALDGFHNGIHLDSMA